jgi:hypothetical protein
MTEIGDGSAGLGSPTQQIVCVQSNAKKVGGNKSELSGSHSDDAENDAIDACDDPTLPQLLSEENCRKDGQKAGKVIKPNHGLFPGTSYRRKISSAPVV